MKLLVYGTLKRGRGNNFHLETSKFLREDLTANASYFMTHVGFPQVSEKEDGHFIKGELWEVSEHDLPHVDRLEGHPDWYERKEVELMSGEKAWMYIMPEEIQSGYKVMEDEQNVQTWG